MNYEVYWSKAAFAQLTFLWLRAGHPEGVMDADDVNRLLAEAPGDRGESRSSLAERVWFHAPFRIALLIDEGRREVEIIDVQWIGG